MSKIFNRIQKAEQRTGSKTGFPRLEIDGWLREIHESVEEQVTGVELDAERPMPSVAVEVFSKIERPPIEETPISDLEFRFGSLRPVFRKEYSPSRTVTAINWPQRPIARFALAC